MHEWGSTPPASMINYYVYRHLVYFHADTSRRIVNHV